MRIRTRFRLAATAVVLALLATACGVTRDDDAGGAAEGALTDLRIIVPNNPGGGYDITARTAAKAMEDAGIARAIEVFNLAGAGGTVALARLVNERGNGELMMMMGLGVVGSQYTNQSAATLADTTPLARLIEEPGIIVVSADSPYDTLDDLLQTWKADPGSVTAGGASSPGGPDYLLTMQLAKTVGIDPKQVNYVGYDSGGQLLPAVLGDRVGFAASGVGEYLDQVQAGTIRVLAVTSEERLDNLDAPTLTEQDVDFVFTNWRGLVAPPGIDQASRETLLRALDALHESTQWQDALETNGWTGAYLTGGEFAGFLEEQDQRVRGLLSELGLA
jgi:putative tricarboxylic transport membrane protein